MQVSLVGRTHEVARVERVLTELTAGSPGCLVLAGPPGIGKSRLLGECVARAEHAKCLVLASRAGEFERDVPFGLLVDAVEDYLASLPADALEPLGADRSRRLAMVLPVLAPWAADERAADARPSPVPPRRARAARVLAPSPPASSGAAPGRPTARRPTR